MAGAFGVTFELPVVTFFLARIGLVTHRMMIGASRYAIVAIFVIAAVLTPGPDVASQMLMATPLLLVGPACGDESSGPAAAPPGDEANRDVARGVLLAIPVDLRKRVTKVTARSRDDVTLGMGDGATVRWGGVEDSALKARVLAGLTAVPAVA